MKPQAFHHKVFACCYSVFPLLSTTCAHACCFILHLHNLAATQTDVLRITLVDSTSSRRSLLQSAACGGRLRLSFRCYLLIRVTI
jgi:hypothetical protein